LVFKEAVYATAEMHVCEPGARFELVTWCFSKRATFKF